MAKIIGVTVGSPLPKPNLKQTDPAKGDFVHGKDIIPTKVSQLENDKKYLTEHQNISGKLDASALPTAINTALAQAKASGEFKGERGSDGKDGRDGTSVTVTSVRESTADGGSNVVTFSDGKTVTIKNGSKGSDGKNYVLTEADKNAIAEQAAQLVDVPEGGGSQADWNAAEGEPGHVLNRTHWVEGGMVEVLAETTYTQQSFGTIQLETPLGITSGKTYVVNWNGVEYTCTAFTFMYAGTFKITILGDYPSITGTTTGEIPFGMAEYSQELVDAAGLGFRFCINPNVDDGNYEYTVSMFENAEVVHKLDPKYLPDGLPYVEGGGMVEILPECQPIYDEIDQMFVLTDVVEGVEDGNTYKVKWNGTEYECVAQMVEENGAVMYLLGNIGAMMGGEDTGEPFLMSVFSADVAASAGIGGFIIPLDGSTELTLSIYTVGEVVHKLDNKFLDLDWLPTTLPKTLYSNPSFCFDMTVQSDNGRYWVNAFDTVNILPLVVGKQYSVTWDGVEYVRTAYEAYTGFVALGNEGLGLTNGEWTDEPFFVASGYGAEWNTSYTQYTAQTTEEEYLANTDVYRSVVIEDVEGGPNKLPEEYLSDGVPYVKENVLLKETSAVSFTHPSFGTMWGVYDGVPELRVGETYTVTYNGTPYHCVCQQAPAGLI